MIIVEGPDGGGKTTLVKRLCEDFDMEVRPRASTSENGPVDDLVGWLLKDFASNLHTGIYDRHPLISEMIYGPILRGDASRLGLTGYQWEELWNKLVEAKPLIIYCLPPKVHVRMNVAANHEPDTPHLEGVLKYCDALWASYQYRFFRDQAGEEFKVIQWDYTGESLALSSPDIRYETICSLVHREVLRNG